LRMRKALRTIEMLFGATRFAPFDFESLKS
jgi:hypothetical protein